MDSPPGGDDVRGRGTWMEVMLYIHRKVNVVMGPGHHWATRAARELVCLHMYGTILMKRHLLYFEKYFGYTLTWMYIITLHNLD